MNIHFAQATVIAPFHQADSSLTAIARCLFARTPILKAQWPPFSPLLFKASRSPWSRRLWTSSSASLPQSQRLPRPFGPLPQLLALRSYYQKTVGISTSLAPLSSSSQPSMSSQQQRPVAMPPILSSSSLSPRLRILSLFSV